MDRAEVAAIRLEEDAPASPLDAKHRRGTVGQRSVCCEQKVRPPSEVHLQPLVLRFLDRDVPARRAAGARVPAEVVACRCRQKPRCGARGCSILRIQITE